MRTVTRIALWIALASACGGKPAEPPPAPPAQGIEMVSYGAMPQQTLRYQLTKGQKTAVEMEVDLDLVSSTQQRTMPTAVTVMELGADDVLAGGDAKVRTTILRASARERPGAQTSLEVMNAQAALLSGLEITGTLTPDGRVKEARLAKIANLPPSAAAGAAALVAQAEEVAMPLPEQAVGVGAIWRVRRDAVQLGIKLQTLTELEVTSLEGQRVGYAMRTQVKGDDQRTTLEGVPVEVKNIRGTGHGKGVLDLGRMVIFGEQTVELGFDMTAQDQAGSSESSSVKMRTAKRLKPAPAAEAAPATAGTTPDPKAPAKADPRAQPDPGAH